MSFAKVVLIVQARMGSTRLPGKSLMDLAGKPLVGRILERLKRCKKIDEIVLATTDSENDNVLADLGNTYSINVFRGSENDLLDRYYQAAKYYTATVVGRFPADNPVPEPSEIDRIVDVHLRNQNVFTSNLSTMMDNKYPDGIGAEMINFAALESVWKENMHPNQREHVATNFYNYATQKVIDKERFPVGTVECPRGFQRPDLVLDVNTYEDYLFLKTLYDDLYPKNKSFSIIDIIKWYDSIYQKPTLI
jgi:spore coat polysaccharide biosynthesis protein SpsF